MHTWRGTSAEACEAIFSTMKIGSSMNIKSVDHGRIMENKKQARHQRDKISTKLAYALQEHHLSSVTHSIHTSLNMPHLLKLGASLLGLSTAASASPHSIAKRDECETLRQVKAWYLAAFPRSLCILLTARLGLISQRLKSQHMWTLPCA